MEPSDWDPDIYPSLIRTEIEDYEVLQDQMALAARGLAVRVGTILDLGIGEGETSKRVLEQHPDAFLHGIDSSKEMLAAAKKRLPEDRIQLTCQDLSEPLPPALFDLVISALAVHHLEGDRKGELFRRIADRMIPTSRFVLGDVVVPDDPADAVIENEEGYDFPSPVSDLMTWLTEAGFEARVFWQKRDLAVLTADLIRPPERS